MTMGMTAKLLAAVASTALLAMPAAAQRIDRIVAFGDSYADDGNLFQLLGVPPPAVYSTGRFSDGINFVDTMGTLLRVPVDNFAIGGAFTGPGNTGFTNINGPGIPGFPTEVGAFLTGGGPAAFPRVNGRFGARDLAVISIGGNDARFFRLNGGTVARAPAAAAISVAEAAGGINQLVNAGARNITFLAGDVGRLPEAIGTPTAAIGTAFSSAFNTGIQARFAELANQGVIVNYLDLNKVGDVVAANLSEFGLVSAGACPVECATTRRDLLGQYLFYVDQVHLSSAGFAIVGRYAVAQLEAPLTLQATGDVGLETANTFAQTMTARLDLSEARSGGGTGGLRLFATGSFGCREAPPTETSFEYDLDTAGATLGAEYEAGGAVVGIAGNYSRPEADFTNAAGRTKGDVWQVGVYGGWASPAGGFVQGYAGYGWADYEIERRAVIDDIAAETDGKLFTAGGKAGWLFGMETLRAGPVVGVRYARAKLDSYTETGDPVLTLNVSDQKVTSLIGTIGAEVRADWDVGGLSVQPYAMAALERDFENDDRTIAYALTAAPTIVNRLPIEKRSRGSYSRVAGGANFALGGTVALQAGGTVTFSRDQGNDFAGFVGLKAGF